VSDEESESDDDPLHFLKRVFPDEVFEERKGYLITKLTAEANNIF